MPEQVILVTGASSGIGLHIAHALIKRGARVAFAARSFDRLEKEVTTAGPNALAVRLDVTDDASAHAAVAAVVEKFGRLDVLVNNAGNAGQIGWWSAMSPSAAADSFAVHVLGSERMLRAALPVMRRQGGGVVVNFSSTVGFVPLPGAALYSAAKAAVNAFTEAVRTELAYEHIDVRLYAPPHTRTETQGLPLDLPKIFEPAWVAENFADFLGSGRARGIAGGNGALLLIQRAWPSLAARIMNRLGFKALRSLGTPGARTPTPSPSPASRTDR